MSKAHHNQIIVVSLGQLIQSNQQRAVDAFIEEMTKTGKWFPAARVKAALALDHFWHGTIESYKRGDLQDDAEFRSRINDQLGLNLGDEAFDRCWNAMCEVDDAVKTQLAELKELQDKHGFKLVVVSATNLIQDRFIAEQLGEDSVLAETREDVINSRSYQVGTTNVREQARRAITENKLDIAENEIVSLHNAMRQGASLGLGPSQFRYMPFDTRVPGASIVVTVKNALAIQEDNSKKPGAKAGAIVVPERGGPGANVVPPGVVMQPGERAAAVAAGGVTKVEKRGR